MYRFKPKTLVHYHVIIEVKIVVKVVFVVSNVRGCYCCVEGDGCGCCVEGNVGGCYCCVQLNLIQ